MLRQSLDNPPIERNVFCKIMVLFCTKMKEKVANIKINAYLCTFNQQNIHSKPRNFEGVKK